MIVRQVQNNFACIMLIFFLPLVAILVAKMINASIVLYKHPPAEIKELVKLLRNSARVAEVFLSDNSPENTPEFERMDATYIFNNKNLGYGAAHNIAIRKTIEQKVPFHLVINPDISFASDILAKIEDYMLENTSVGSLMPKVFSSNGEVQYLCKLLPTPFDLIFRRFLPEKWTRKRTEKFELRHTGYSQTMDVPYLSGCFMFLRTEALQKVGLFDERFFMYPEDIDLTRRIHKEYRTVFYPEVSIVHGHEKGSYKDKNLLKIHIENMIKYFNKWGWAFDKDRKRTNRDVVKQLNIKN